MHGWCTDGARPSPRAGDHPLIWGQSITPGLGHSGCTGLYPIATVIKFKLGCPPSGKYHHGERASGGGARGRPGAGGVGGASKGTGAGGGRAGNRKWPGQMLGEEPRGPLSGRRIQNGRGAALVRAGNPKGSGGGRGSGGESQGLRGRAKVGREHQGHLRRAGDPRSTWGGRGERIVGRSWVAGVVVEKGIRIARTPMLLRRASGTVRASD